MEKHKKNQEFLKTEYKRLNLLKEKQEKRILDDVRKLNPADIVINVANNFMIEKKDIGLAPKTRKFLVRTVTDKIVGNKSPWLARFVFSFLTDQAIGYIQNRESAKDKAMRLMFNTDYKKKEDHQIQYQKPMRTTENEAPELSSFKKITTSLKEAGKKWWARDPFRQSSIIAYYSIFSLPALLVIVIAVAGIAFGREAVSGQLSQQIGDAMGKDTAKQVSDMIAKSNTGNKSIIASIIGFVVLLFGAAGVFTQLQTSLNLIWSVEVKPTLGFMKTVKDNLFSFGLILSIGFLLLISLVVTSTLTVMGSWLQHHFPESLIVLVHILNFILSLGIIAVLFALMFKILPDAKVKWRDVWIGAIFTSLLFTIGKYGLAIYFSKANPGSAYGAAGSIILILLWVSYSCMIFFLGAEFTRKYAEIDGNKIEPTENAVAIPDPEPKK